MYKMCPEGERERACLVNGASETADSQMWRDPRRERERTPMDRAQSSRVGEKHGVSA